MLSIEGLNCTCKLVFFQVSLPDIIYEYVHNNLELIIVSTNTKQATFLEVIGGEILQIRGLLN